MIRVAAALLLCLATTLGQPVQAQTAQPTFATTKVEGTDNVYIFRYLNHQAMFVVTSEGVIATDPIPYARREASQVYLDEIKKITNKPVKYVIYSHHHYDHIAGGRPFKDVGAIFVAHHNAKLRLVALGDPNTVLPDQTLRRQRTIKLGDTTIELKYVGLNHSDSSLVMRLPKHKIIFAVDFLPVGSLPGRGMIDSHPIEWEASIQQVLKMDWDRLIPGHPGPGGRLGTKDDVRKLATMLQDMSSEVKESARAGQCWEPAERDVKLEKYKDWPGFNDATRLMIVRRYCGLWGRGT
jgi:glyoxylase-like metal-dependent hydrolase (beta-lactamase superfamily II)